MSRLFTTLRSAGDVRRFSLHNRLIFTLPQKSVQPILTHCTASNNIIVDERQQELKMSEDIEELHALAIQEGSTTYTDPNTGFTVFTELVHLKRGTCCGNQCRHCPFGWENVAKGTKRQGKCKSGDMDAAKRLVDIMTTQKQTNEVAFISTGVDNSRPNGKYPEKKMTNIESCLPPASGAPPEGKGGRKGGKYTSKNVPYTRKGDKGTSQLLTGEHRSKADDAFEAMGTVDELCTVVGVVHAELTSIENAEELFADLLEWLLDVMSRLFDLGSHVAKPKKETESEFDADGVGGGFDEKHIQQLEDWIDVMTEDLPELVSFILPTGSKGAAQLQVARTVCRRAERRVVNLVADGVSDPNGLRYLNRLSDFFFTAARWVNFREGREEIQYRREYRGAKQRTRQAVSLASGGKTVV